MNKLNLHSISRGYIQRPLSQCRCEMCLLHICARCICRGGAAATFVRRSLELPHAGNTLFHAAPTNPPQTKMVAPLGKKIKREWKYQTVKREGKKKDWETKEEMFRTGKDKSEEVLHGGAGILPLSIDSWHRTGFKLWPESEERPMLKQRRCQDGGVVERNCSGPTTTPIPHPPSLLIGREELAMDWNWAWEDGFGFHYLKLC